MPTHRPPLIVLAFTLFLATCTGCKEGQKGGQAPQGTATAAAAPAPAKPGFTPQTYEGVTFQYPNGWSSAPSEEGKGQMVAAPDADGEWPPAVSLRVFENLATPDLQKAVDDAAVTLQRKDRFTLKEKTVTSHPGGFKYGRVEYSSERGTISLTQWEILIPMSGGKRLVVHANSATDDWPKYQPVFAEIVDSIRLPKSGG
jgi:hypothetical protein